MAFIHILLTVICAFISREDDILPYRLVGDFRHFRLTVICAFISREDDILPYGLVRNFVIFG